MGQLGLNKFYEQNWNHTATLITGGTVMAIVAIYEWFWRKKTAFKFLGCIFLAFLFMAFFEAWQDESLKRMASELDDAHNLKEADHYKKRAESLSDTMLKSNFISRPASPVISNNNQSSVAQGNTASNITISPDYSFKPEVVNQTVGGDNNGQMVANSPGASVTMIVKNLTNESGLRCFNQGNP